MFGANDNQAVQTSSGKVHQFGSDGWKKEYRKRVEDVIALLYQNGVRRVYWIGQPIMPDSSFNDQVKLLNDIYRAWPRRPVRRPVHRRVQAPLERRRAVCAVPARRRRQDAEGP